MKTLLFAAIVMSLAFSAARADDAPGNPGGAKLQEFLKSADRNGDGQLDVGERLAVSKNIEDFLRKQFLANSDTNGDGKIDMSERARAMQAVEKQRFDWMKSLAAKFPAANSGLANGAIKKP